MARKTVAGCVERITELYEHGADAIRTGQYVRRWWRWLRSEFAGNPTGRDGHEPFRRLCNGNAGAESPYVERE